MTQLILMPDPQIVPRAMHRIGDAFDDIRKALYTSTEVHEVFPLWWDLRQMANEALQLADLAATRAEHLMEDQ